MRKTKFDQEKRELGFTTQVIQGKYSQNQKTTPVNSDVKIKVKKTGSFVRPKYS